LEKKKQLPTQLYISVNAPNKEVYDKIHRSSKKDAWERLNKSLEIMSTLKGKTRTVFRMNLILDLNMLDEHAEKYAELIKKANPMFVEVKAFMCVGFANKRIAYEKMPYHEDIIAFSKKVLKFLPEYKLLDEKKESRVALLGKSKRDMKIKAKEV
jgi:tRNA wybutosine-synthesizing protein 1